MPDMRAEHRAEACQSDFARVDRLFRLLQLLLQFDAIAHRGETPLLHKLPTLQPACFAMAGRDQRGLAMSTTVQNEKTQGKRRRRPLTATQERLFFGALFAIAALVQVGVVWAQIIR
jgi:hypothetical protein